jgi:Flp pilus assembly pilin Flp
MLSVFVHLQVTLTRLQRDDRGQTTAEYALVLLGAAAVALVLVAWATKSGKITQLFDSVIDHVLSKL